MTERNWVKDRTLDGGQSVDVFDWLRDLGLGQYEAAFRKIAIDGAALPNLTTDDLKDVGVTAVGHRRKMLDAIAVLRGGVLVAPASNDVADPQSAPSPSPAREVLRRTVPLRP